MHRRLEVVLQIIADEVFNGKLQGARITGIARRVVPPDSVLPMDCKRVGGITLILASRALYSTF